MPLPVAHALLGATVVAAVDPRPFAKRRLPLIVGALLANSPDLDFLLVRALHSRAWHRAFTHSLCFALLVALVLFILPGAKGARRRLAYGLAFMSHGILDYATTRAGGGVELLWPFSLERFRLGLLGLSEIPSRLPPAEVVRALLIEVAIFAPLLLGVVLLRQRARSSPREGGMVD